MHVDGALFHVDVAAPDPIEQLLTGVDPVRVAHEELEHAVFGGTKGHGLALRQHAVGHRVERWTVRWDGAADVQTAVVGPPGDFPVIPAAQQGYAYDHAWMLTFNPQRTAPPVVGGVGNALFDTLLRIDFTGKPPQAFTLPANGGFNEPVHVPSREPGHEGWLLAVADFELSPESSEHACLIFNAGDVAAGPVAKVILPRRQRPQIHGCWVSAEKLATAN